MVIGNAHESPGLIALLGNREGCASALADSTPSPWALPTNQEDPSSANTNNPPRFSNPSQFYKQ